MATTTNNRKEVEASPFLSTGRYHPPPPSTPYLTEKILTLASSCDRHGRDGDSRQHGPLPPPVSPTDSVAQAMKNDLEELIGYIDNLAFEPKDEKSVPKIAGTTSTNKELFPGGNNPSNTGYHDHTSEQNSILRDRTNRFITSNVGQNNLPGKLGDPEVASATSRPNLMAKTKIPTRYHQPSVNLIRERKEQESKMLEPVGNALTRREEPAGSPPSQEASFYFHYESFSLNLSQSHDVDESNVGDNQFNIKRPMGKQDRDRSEKPPRLLSTLQKSGLISSPERSKIISFIHVSKDPTPSKPPTNSTSSNQIHFATPGGLVKTNFDSIDEDDIELRSTDALGRKVLGNRQATPFTRNQDRDLDRLEQENADRKGNEWWRTRPIPDIDPAQRYSSLLDNSFSNENTDGKSLKWVENIKSPLRGPQYASAGTPNPSSRIDDRKTKEIVDPILETPVPHQGGKSNLVLTSPESAKKLLRNAMEALQDARKERDAARQWASDIKLSVNEWVDDQRRLIRTESASASVNSIPISAAVFEQNYQAIEDSINALRNEMKTSKSDSETQLHTFMVNQDDKIRELSRELISLKDQLSHVMKDDTSKTIGAHSVLDKLPNKLEKPRRLHNVDAPGLAHKTPINETTGLVRSASRSEASHASRGSHRTRRSTPSGGHLIDYGNGVTKELHKDGTTVTRFKNGDVETRFGPNKSTSSSPAAMCMVAYYHCKEEVLQITQRDGSVLYEYANGQVERHCADGVKIVLFPDGTKAYV